MKWTWVAVGLFLLAVCQADGFDEVGELDYLTITKIQKGDSSVTPATYDITFKTETIPEGIKMYLLDISTNDEGGSATQEFHNVTQMCSSAICTITFPFFITMTIKTNVDFDLSRMTIKGEEEIVGTTSYSPFPEFSDDLDGDLVNDSGHYILRLSGDNKDMDEFTPPPGGIQVTSDSTQTTYFLNSDSLENIAACYNNGDCLLCGNNVPLDPTRVIQKDLSVDSALLKYGEKGLNTIVTITVIPTKGETKIDVLKTDTTPGQAFTSLSLTADVPIDNFTPEMDIPMTIIGISEDGKMLEYADFSIQDMNVILNPVSKSSFEVRWNYQEGVNEYIITRTFGESDTGFREATVTCDGTSFQHCYGYFTHLQTSNYKATVPVRTAGDRQVQSASIHVGDLQPDLNIQHVQLQGYGNVLKATVCFNHTNNNAEEAFSHYDVVLIDRNGQFQKDKLLTIKAARGDHFCSRPFSVKDQDFEVTEEAKVIVIKRAQDGLSVLASGEAPLL